MGDNLALGVSQEAVPPGPTPEERTTAARCNPARNLKASSADAAALCADDVLARRLLFSVGAWPIPRLETASLNGWEEVAAMGGPWRERGFDAASLRSPRPHRGRRVEALAGERQQDGLGKLVLVYIAAVAMSFGLMLGLMQHGW